MSKYAKTSPNDLFRAFLEKNALSLQEIAERAEIPYNTLRNWVAPADAPRARAMPKAMLNYITMLYRLDHAGNAK